LTYGKFDYFAGGDLQFNDKSNYSWKDIETPVAKVVTAVDVMKANHHGTSNCNSDALLKKLVPQTVLIHTWRDVQPNPETVGRIYAANSDCKLFTTNMTDANKIRLSDYLSKFYSTQGHIVVRVAPQGLQYTIYVLDDSNEEYKVKERFGPYQCNDAAKGKDVKKHYISFQDNEDLYRFYRYRKNAKPIVQGHRGSIENDLPESSIASMEYVLEQMPAVFEIDPRLTKDSVIIVFHDAALERSSTGKGKVIDHTWAELQQLFLKNEKGEVTKYKIHTLAEILEWARGKTALVLDKKDVPLKMIADIIREHDANNYVMNMVRSPEDAKFYYEDDNRRMFSVSIRTPDVFYAYMKAGIPKKQIFACIGTEITKETPKLCRLLRKNGIRCLMATAASYDKLDTSEKRAQAYRNIIKNGATIMESNYPVEAGKALSITKPTQE
jgi:glycerophosphoryl diester phosphodiesterase